MLNELRDAMAATLDGELDRFFPAAVDANGGFYCHFDSAWVRRDLRPRNCVYLARLTWVAATVALRRPHRAAAYLKYARHGVETLLTTYADRAHGGFFWNDARDTGLDRKLLYNHAFALYALAAAARATDDAATLAAAVEAFTWLEVVLYDATHGGYAEAAHRDGRLITAADAPSKVTIDTPLGAKSINAQIHVLEALTELYRAWPDASVERRLVELIELIAVRLPDPLGFLPAVYESDWTPVAGRVSYGHDVEAAFLLADAASAIGRPDDASVWAVAGRLWENAFRFGVDVNHGGIFDAGRPGEPASFTQKVWWAQAEAVQSLLMMHERVGHADGRYWHAFERAWNFCRRHLIDLTAGGWRSEVSADGKTVLSDARATNWKACYHTARAMLNGIDSLDRLASRG